VTSSICKDAARVKSFGFRVGPSLLVLGGWFFNQAGTVKKGVAGISGEQLGPCCRNEMDARFLLKMDEYRLSEI